MPAEIPEPVGVVGAVAATIVAVAAAIKKAVIPMFRGLQALAKAHQDVIEGAQLARQELAPNSGHSMKDRLEQAAERAELAQTQAEANAGRIEAVEEQVQRLRGEMP